MLRIKRYREALGLTMKEAAQALHMPYTTYVNYEKGSREPNSEALIAIAKFYGVTVDELLGRNDITTIPFATPAPTDADTIVYKYGALNEEGQLILMEMADFLKLRYAAFPELEKELEEPEDNIIDLGEIRWYLHTSAAGYSAPVLTEDYIEVPRTVDMPPQADYCITIAGDSMEPYIHDRQRVFVDSKSRPAEMDDVGIWSFQGETFCKQYCIDSTGAVILLSANPRRQDANRRIRREELGDLRCLGKVLLGKKLPPPQYE